MNYQEFLLTQQFFGVFIDLKGERSRQILENHTILTTIESGLSEWINRFSRLHHRKLPQMSISFCLKLAISRHHVVEILKVTPFSLSILQTKSVGSIKYIIFRIQNIFSKGRGRGLDDFCRVYKIFSILRPFLLAVKYPKFTLISNESKS